MDIKTYNDVINLSLLWKMKDLITRINDKKQYSNDGVSLFGNEPSKFSMEKMYGFRYPGEVLERYRERCGDTLENLRALAIALAEEKDWLTDSMFIGGQKATFISLIRSRAEKDIYLQGALYLLTDRQTEKSRLEKFLKEYSANTSHEFFYLQSLLLGEADGYTADLQQFCFFLDEGRTMKAYGNENIFAWILNHFMQAIKDYRKKDGWVLKALIQLLSSHIKKGSMYWDRLLAAGYSEQEVIFLNMRLPTITNMKCCLHQDSITMERIVAHGCLYILNAEYVEDPLLFEQVMKFLSLYKKFDRNIEGYGGLTRFLENKVSVRNVNLFLYLYKNRQQDIIHQSWLQIDLLEDRWNKLPELLTKEEYLDVFESSFFKYGGNCEAAWVEKYEKMCGESYINRFWNENSKYSVLILKKLIRIEVFDISSYLVQYAEDEKTMDKISLDKKWKHMFIHLSGAAKKIDCHGIYSFWETYDRLYGMESLRDFLGKQDIVTDTVGFERWSYYNRNEQFWAGLDYLSKDEQQKLFFWECDELYLHYPEYYNAFLICFLEKKGHDLFPKKQCRIWLSSVIEDLHPDSYQAQQLRNMYYTEKELNEYRNQEKQREEEKENNQRLQWKQEIQEGMDAADRVLSRLEIWGQNFNQYSFSAEYYKVAYSCLLEELEKGNCQVGYKKIDDVIKAMVKIMVYEVINWSEFRDLIMKMEVIENESR